MDVVVGKISPVGATGDRSAEPPTGVEARVLHVRPGRRRKDPEKRGRKQTEQPPDPPGARVLVLMVPDAHRLPEDLASGRYRVFLRFVRK